MSAIAARPARRSCLSVPASSARKLDKAPSAGADEVVIDLEDAVAPLAKADAREAAVAASLGRSEAASGDLGAWRGVQDAVLVAARAHGLQAIDGPYLGVAVDQAFMAAATRARDLGFDGKWAIHPSQVSALNELFTPSEEEVTRAEAIVEALARAEREAGQGAVALHGTMLDEAMRVAALGVLARAGREPATS